MKLDKNLGQRIIQTKWLWKGGYRSLIWNCFTEIKETENRRSH